MECRGSVASKGNCGQRENPRPAFTCCHSSTATIHSTLLFRVFTGLTSWIANAMYSKYIRLEPHVGVTGGATIKHTHYCTVYICHIGTYSIRARLLFCACAGAGPDDNILGVSIDTHSSAKIYRACLVPRNAEERPISRMLEGQ